jgi:CRISPR/Cas system CSM-associated protein Csm3 (group 7 of RAMP superfamily)
MLSRRKSARQGHIVERVQRTPMVRVSAGLDITVPQIPQNRYPLTPASSLKGSVTRNKNLVVQARIKTNTARLIANIVRRERSAPISKCDGTRFA